MRLISPAGEVIAPGEFLPVAEAHGLIREIDRRVFDLAMRHAAAGHRVAINVSAESISEPGLFRYVEEQLAAHSVDPRLVIFEITETALVHNEGVAQVFIESVSSAGLRSCPRRLRHGLRQLPIPQTPPGQPIEDRPGVRPRPGR